jgi:hypothetical protein
MRQYSAYQPGQPAGPASAPAPSHAGAQQVGRLYSQVRLSKRAPTRRRPRGNDTRPGESYRQASNCNTEELPSPLTDADKAELAELKKRGLQGDVFDDDVEYRHIRGVPATRQSRIRRDVHNIGDDPLARGRQR